MLVGLKACNQFPLGSINPIGPQKTHQSKHTKHPEVYANTDESPDEYIVTHS